MTTSTLADPTRETLFERARLSEERFDLAVTACGLGLWDFDQATGRLYLSPGWKALLGYADAELPNHADTFFGRLHPDDRERVATSLARFEGEAGERSDRIEFRLRHRAGRWVWVVSRGAAVRDHTGRAVRLVGTLTDVTAQVEAEAAVRSSEERLRTLLESARDVILVLAPDGRRRFVSGASVRLSGYRPDELVGASVFDNIHPDDRPAVRAALADAVARPGEERRVEFRYRVAAGRYAHLEASGVDLSDVPAVGGVLVSARDITERRRLEDQFRQSQKLEALGLLAGGVAHDFNNLLTVVLGNLDLLTPSAGDRKLIDQVQAAGDRARGLVASLLRFARTGEPAAPRTADLGGLLAATAEVLRRTLDKRIAVVVRVPADLPPAVCDPGAVEQAVFNLCLNARDAMPDGGTLTVAAEVVTVGQPSHPDARPGRFVAISVTDTGTGMTPEVLARVFEPFFTTKGEGKGTGLGLAMVADTARRQGGWVTAESVPGECTRFELVLPAADAVPTPLAGRVLVVDDEEMIRTLAAAVLERAGYTVEAAADGPAALAAYRAKRPDVVVLDLSLPGPPGESVLADLLAADPSARVVLVSGMLPDTSPTGAAGVLAKPFTPARLLAAVRAAQVERPA